MRKRKTQQDSDKELAKFAKALAHPSRVQILRFLEKQCTCFAGDIGEQLPLAASTVSQHLKVLRSAGLIQGKANPPTITYCINQENWQRAKMLFENLFEQKS